jgi:hypothetical protein
LTIFQYQYAKENKHQSAGELYQMYGNDIRHPGAHQDGKSVRQKKGQHHTQEKPEVFSGARREQQDRELCLVAHLGQSDGQQRNYDLIQRDFNPLSNLGLSGFRYWY